MKLIHSSRGDKMNIFIDADGCPVVDIAVNLARKNKLKAIIVKNYAHQITSDYAEVVSVDISNDSADFYIVNNAKKGDIVITQDYGLASLCLSKKIIPINQNGLVFTSENIDGFLNIRHIHSNLRRTNKRHSNPKKRTKDLDVKFKNSLNSIIKKSIG